MRILHISTRLILGGSQENTVLSCEGQARLGHEVHLAYGPIYGPEGSMLERVQAFNKRCVAGEELTVDGRPCQEILLHEVSQLRRTINPWHDFWCLWQIRRLLKRLRPVLLHTHSSKAGILGRAASARLRPQRRGGAVWHLKDGSEVWRDSDDVREPPTPEEWSTTKFTGLFHGKYTGPAVVHTVHGPPFHQYQSNLKNRIYVASERYAAKRCHTIVSVADAMTEQYLARKIGTPDQYVTVRSGMEVEHFLDPAPGEDRASMRAELGFNDDDYVIGTVARLAELKGHDDLLDALGDELTQRDNWKLLWVGDGWWRDRLMKRVEELGLKDKVVTTGLVPPERVPAMIRAMDVLAHPSYREGLPRTVPQALLCSVPPIAYDVDGTGEACRTGETGVLIQPGDLDALRAAAVRLYEHPDERRELADTGREWCRTTFSAKTMVDELEKVYERAITIAS